MFYTAINIKTQLKWLKFMAVVQPQKLFVGYSTLGTNSKRQQFADIELINRDLISNFYTRPGERLMLPGYGCGIWDLLFEQFDQVVKDSIEYEVKKVIANDPRVSLQNTVVTQFEQGILIQMTLLYIPLSVVKTFTLTFNSTQIS